MTAITAIVIGGGIIGATTADRLARDGHKVLLIEQDEPASGASFANGGQLSACHTTPWANPSAPLKVAQWAFGKDESPLLFTPHADIHQLTWLAKFLWNCLPSKTAYNTKALLKLALHSRAAMAEANLDENRYDRLDKGILHFYRTKSELRDAARDVALMNSHGLDRRFVTVEEAIGIEPALKPIQSELVGATFTLSDSSGDAAKYTKLALYNSAVTVMKSTAVGLTMVNGKAAVMIADKGLFGSYTVRTADVVVVCAGVWSRELVKPFGINLNIYPARGFSATIRLQNSGGQWVKGPRVSLTDDERKLVYSRLGDNLRVAGTASLNGYSNLMTAKDRPRCENLLKAAQQTLGLPDDLWKVDYWSGLRPLTSSNRPYVCKTHIPNLYLNTGHGSLGWTLSAGSADLLAGIIKGKPPTDETPFSLAIPH